MRLFRASASWIFALIVLLAVPAAAGELPALAPSPDAPQVGVPAPVNADCGFNLETVLPGKSGLCPAPKNAAVMPSLPGLNGQAELPEFLAAPVGFRTCRCSCGAPCKTDADCGPGGICGAGITCC